MRRRSFIASACLLLTGCASFRDKGLSQMTDQEREDARRDQTRLADFLSLGHLEGTDGDGFWPRGR